MLCDMNAKMAEALHIKAYLLLTKVYHGSGSNSAPFQAVIQESKLIVSHSSAIGMRAFPTSLGSGRQGWKVMYRLLNTSKPRLARTGQVARGTGKCGESWIIKKYICHSLSTSPTHS